MKGLTALTLLLAGVSVSAHSELLRGNHRRLDGGACTSKADCNNNGKCKGVQKDAQGNVVPNSGECDCEPGFTGPNCGTEQCGDVVSCGRHGKCDNKDQECICKTGYTGDACDEEVEYEMRVIAIGVNPARVKSMDDCDHEIDDFMHAMEDLRTRELTKLDTVTYVDTGEVPGDCGDQDYHHSLERVARGRGSKSRHLKSSSSSSDDEDEEVILVGMAGNTRTFTSTCLHEIEHAARRLEKRMKPKDLEKMDGEFVFLEDGDCDDVYDILKHLKHSKSKRSK